MLHGRAVEQATVDRLLAGARAGTSGALVIRGEMGVGKTALLDYAEARATETGMRVLRRTGVESEVELPFAALHLLLGPFLRLVETLPAAQAAALRGAFGLAAERESDRFLIGMAALTTLAELAGDGPLLCLVDDVQWVDRPTVDALMFAARRLDAEGIVMIFAAAGDELGALPEVRLAGLEREAAASLLGADKPVRWVLDRLLREARGNPLALVELSAALTPEQRAGSLTDLPLAANGAPVTSRTQNAFLARIRDLPMAARTMLLVSAADDTGDLHVIRAAGTRLGAALADLGAAEEAALVRVVETTLTFRHPLIRMAAYHHAPAADRIAAHRALASVLRGASHADRRTWHRAAATSGRDERTARELEATARRAVVRQGHAAAAAAYERAAELSASGRSAATRFTAAARAAFAAGQLNHAVRLADQAREAFRGSDAEWGSDGDRGSEGDRGRKQGQGSEAGRGSGAGAEAADITRLRASFAFEQGCPARAGRLLVDGAAASAPGASGTAAVMLAEAARAAWYAGDVALARQAAAALGELAHPPESASAALAATVSSLADLLLGESAAGVGRIHAMLRSARRSPPADPGLALVLASAGLATADHRTSCDLAERLVAACRTEGLIGSLAGALVVLARAQLFLGRHRDAEATVAEGLRLASDTGQHHTVNHLNCLFSWLAAVAGRDVPHHDVTPESDVVGAAMANWAAGLVDLGAGRYTAAVERLADGWSGPSLVAAYLSVPDLVEAAYRSGRAGEAAGAFRRFEIWAEMTGQSAPDAVAHRCRALLLPTGEGRGDHFDAAMRAHQLDEQPYELARTELLYGQWLRRSRHRHGARELLRSARDRFDHLGAGLWKRRAEAELRATGDLSRAQNTDPLSRLTAQERQVAELASRGASNRDIAAQLFLSPRTVGNHLYNAFRKLGITSRHDLERLLRH